MTAFWLELGATTAENIFLCLIVGGVAGWRHHGRRQAAEVTAAVLILTLLVHACNRISPFSLFTPLVTISAIVFGTSHIYTKGTLLLRTIGCMLGITSVLIIDYITCLSLGLAFDWGADTLSIVITPGPYRVLFVVIDKSLDLILFFSIRRFLRHFFQLGEQAQKKLLGICLISFILLQVSFNGFTKMNTRNIFLSFSLQWVLLSIVLLAAVNIFLTQTRLKQHQMALQNLEANSQALLKEYQQLQQTNREKECIQHDFSNHLIALRPLLDHAEEARQYVDGLLQTQPQPLKVCDCGCALIDTILSAKAQEASENGIDFRFNASFLENSGLPPADICTILSNQIDNALEACKKLPPDVPRIVTVRIGYKNRMALFKVDNTVDKNPLLDNPQLKTTKIDGTRKHGLGIANIQRVVSAHSGILTHKYKDGIFSSCATLHSM